MTHSWEDMLDEFRGLGGIAENIVQRPGSRGNGIFPIDRSKPIRLSVPQNLLIPVENIEFVDGELKISKAANVGNAEREFVERYEKAFSWGVGAQSDCAVFLAGMETVSAAMPYRQVINPRIMEAVADVRDPVGRRFLESRSIEVEDGRRMLMPVMELVNHDPSADGYVIADGPVGPVERNVGDTVSIEGQFSDEVLVRYCQEDPFGIFLGYGFASPEPIAFSLPGHHKGPRQLVIDRDISKKGMRGAFPAPEFEIERDRVLLSHLMIGHLKYPRVPKSVFLSIMKEARWLNAEEQFEVIQHNNRMTYLSMLRSMEGQEGNFATVVRKVIRFQLEAMSHCFGTRPLQNPVGT